jgi:DNA-binding NtrC family response regulator
VAISASSKTILLIDDGPAPGSPTIDALKGLGFAVNTSRLEAGAKVDVRGHDAVVASMTWRRGETSSRIAALKRQVGGIPLLLLCPAEHLREAVDALRHGADDYLIQPPDPYELEVRLLRLLESHDLSSRIAVFQDELFKRSGLRDLETRSPAMRAVVERVARVAPMRSTVLINGESGVGKELVARAIHFNSPRRDGPFMALNCAAMPSSLIESELFGHEKGAFTGAHARVRGKFEIADGGTLFLDEIGEMERSTQAKLLRVLEEREFMRIGGDRSVRVDVRVIAATNADLADQVARRIFRRDLYYRLKVVTIEVPPLRERRADVPALVETFLEQLARSNAVERKAIAPSAVRSLQDYEWPGNVRELKNLIESLLVSTRGELIGPEDLPASVRKTRSPTSATTLGPGITLAQMERELIRRTLEHTGGNRTHSASLLGIGVRTLQRKIQAYELSIPPTRRRSKRRDDRDEGGSDADSSS